MAMKLSTIIKQKKAYLKQVSPKQRDRARHDLRKFEVAQRIKKELVQPRAEQSASGLRSSTSGVAA